jgi:hypothetical protein
VMAGHNDRVGKLLSDFREEVEKLCRPIVAERFRRPVARWFSILKASASEHATVNPVIEKMARR